jgi:hypothetical protein
LCNIQIDYGADGSLFNRVEVGQFPFGHIVYDNVFHLQTPYHIPDNNYGILYRIQNNKKTPLEETQIGRPYIMWFNQPEKLNSQILDYSGQTLEHGKMVYIRSSLVKSYYSPATQTNQFGTQGIVDISLNDNRDLIKYKANGFNHADYNYGSGFRMYLVDPKLENPGTYSIKYTAVDDYGYSNSISRNVIVEDNKMNDLRQDQYYIPPSS